MSDKKNIQRLTSQEVKEKLDYINNNLTNPDEKTQENIINSCADLWMQKDKANKEGIETSKRTLVVIAQGKYLGFSAQNIQHAQRTLWECLQNYAYKVIHNEAPTYIATMDVAVNKENFDTMVDSCYIEMMKDLSNYDPEKSAPITHFSHSFSHAVAEWKKDLLGKGSKPALKSDIRKLQNAQKRVADKGGDPNDVVLLKEELPSMNYEKISATLAAKKTYDTMQSLDYSQEVSQFSANEKWEPEKVILKKEDNDRFYDVIENLPPIERKICCLRYGFDVELRTTTHPEMSEQDIAALLNISIPQVKANLHRARNLIHLLYTGKRRDERQIADFKEDPGDMYDPRIRFLSDGDDAAASDIDDILEIDINIEADDIEEPPEKF